MPESIQKSAEFGMDSGRGSGTILASNMCPKSLQKSMWPNSKNLDFALKVVQKRRLGRPEASQPKSTQNQIENGMKMLSEKSRQN